MVLFSISSIYEPRTNSHEPRVTSNVHNIEAQKVHLATKKQKKGFYGFSSLFSPEVYPPQ
jgi:hypothetical protein